MDWDKIKAGLLWAAGGAIALAVIGFNYGGWVTGGAAQVLAKEVAATAVSERLGTICVAQVNQDKAREQKLREMKGKDLWDQGRYIDAQSWAIMPGAEKPENGVADACAKQLSAKT